MEKVEFLGRDSVFLASDGFAATRTVCYGNERKYREMPTSISVNLSSQSSNFIVIDFRRPKSVDNEWPYEYKTSSKPQHKTNNGTNSSSFNLS